MTEKLKELRKSIIDDEMKLHQVSKDLGVDFSWEKAFLHGMQVGVKKSIKVLVEAEESNYAV